MPAGAGDGYRPPLDCQTAGAGSGAGSSARLHRPSDEAAGAGDAGDIDLDALSAFDVPAFLRREG